MRAAARVLFWVKVNFINRLIPTLSAWGFCVFMQFSAVLTDLFEDLPVALVLRLEFREQVGAVLFRAAQAHFAPPCLDIGMMAGEQYLGDLAAQ